MRTLAVFRGSARYVDGRSLTVTADRAGLQVIASLETVAVDIAAIHGDDKMNLTIAGLDQASILGGEGVGVDLRITDRPTLIEVESNGTVELTVPGGNYNLEITTSTGNVTIGPNILDNVGADATLRVTTTDANIRVETDSGGTTGSF